MAGLVAYRRFKLEQRHDLVLDQQLRQAAEDRAATASRTAEEVEDDLYPAPGVFVLNASSLPVHDARVLFHDWGDHSDRHPVLSPSTEATFIAHGRGTSRYTN